MTKFRFCLVGLLVSFIGVPAPGIAAEPILSPIKAKNLNDDVVSIPSGKRAVLLFAFEREQQEDVDSWINGLDLAGSGVTWFEVPVIDDPGAIIRWVINSGMRNGIPSPDRRAHVVTLFTDRQSFLTSLGISDVSSCYALVVEPDGKIIMSAFGHYNRETAQKILSLMTENPTLIP